MRVIHACGTDGNRVKVGKLRLRNNSEKVMMRYLANRGLSIRVLSFRRGLRQPAVSEEEAAAARKAFFRAFGRGEGEH